MRPATSAGPLVRIADDLQVAGIDEFAASFDSLIETIECVGSRSGACARTT